MIIEFCKGDIMLLSRPLALLPIAEGDTSKGQRRCDTGDSFFWSLSARHRKLVCVTSGNSYFGAHLIKELLSHGYLIRATIQDEGNLEDMKRLLSDEEMNMLESVVVAKMGDLDNLCDAFRGCHIIFHTSTFIDPHGVSGYTERTAFLEAEGAKNVIEACGRAAYIKRCILTSSLLASIWRHETAYDGSSSSTRIVDETCWSDEEICRQNKLWLALGKTKAEKASWSAAKEMKVRLVTICPGFITVPSSPNAGYGCSLPYMKGGRVMFQRGFLASTDVDKLAKVHVQVYEAMEYGASGRYICFQRVVTRLDEAIRIENVLKLHGILSGGRNSGTSSSSSSSSRTEEEDGGQVQGRISNSKLERLLCQASRRFSCRNEDCIGSV